MIKIAQSERDDCLAACVASILELSLDEVPGPLSHEMVDMETYTRYWERLNLWLKANYGMELCSIQSDGWPEPYGWSIKVVDVERHWLEGLVSHALVACDGHTVWNPCKNEDDDDLPASHWIVFRAINPAILKLDYGKLGSGG